jgi:hypothetical protein
MPRLGLTISRTQFRYVASLGLPARWGDAERTLPPGAFDCALMLESFCHVADKPRLLATLRPFVSRLVMRVNCQDGSAAAARLRRHHAHGLIAAPARIAARFRLAHPPLAGPAARGLAVGAGVGPPPGRHCADR